MYYCKVVLMQVDCMRYVNVESILWIGTKEMRPFIIILMRSLNYLHILFQWVELFVAMILRY